MKNLFCLLLVAFATLISGCLQSGDDTIVLPEKGGNIFKNAEISFVNAEIPAGTTQVISGVQFIVDPSTGTSGSLFVTSSEELSEIYLQIDGLPGYYVRQLSSKDLSFSGTGSSGRSYVYVVDLDYSSVVNAEQNTTVGGKTIGETISISVPTANSSIEQRSCGVSVSGDITGYLGNFNMGQNSGSFSFSYDTYSIPDKITIYEGKNTKGKILFTFEGGDYGNEIILFNESVLTVEVIGLGAGTAWDFNFGCPN